MENEVGGKEDYVKGSQKGVTDCIRAAAKSAAMVKGLVFAAL